MFDRVQIKAQAKGQIPFVLGSFAIILGCGYLLSSSYTLLLIRTMDKQSGLPTFSLWITILALFILIISFPLGYLRTKLALSGFKTQENLTYKQLTTQWDSQEFRSYCIKTIIMGIFVYLWSLLFVIPGIIKSYQYFFVPYIAIEHPDWTWRQCFQESTLLTNNNKGNLFVTTLSFLCWYCLSVFTCGLSDFYTTPYTLLTYAGIYDELTYQLHPPVEPLDYDETKETFSN